MTNERQSARQVPGVAPLTIPAWNLIAVAPALLHVVAIMNVSPVAPGASIMRDDFITGTGVMPASQLFTPQLGRAG